MNNGEQRVIKFRAWEPSSQTMHYNLGFISNDGGSVMGEHRPLIGAILMQFTGKKCFNDREVYEGDILFYEEATEAGDERYYLVVTWIEEWSMFATLHVSEYKMYLIGGADSLDESMFWTYTLEGCDKYHYAGNIYQDKHLLK